MPRKHRLWSPHHYFHIVMRGNNRQTIFLHHADYQAFLRILEYTYQKYQFSIIAFCIMPNHYHLLLRSSHASHSKIMAMINRRYSDYFKKKYDYTGHLYEKRFFSDIVPSALDIIAVSRYIHRNPINTTTPLVEALALYPYSSFYYYYHNIPVSFNFLHKNSLLSYLPHSRYATLELYLMHCEDDYDLQLT
ncbi:transposase [Lysinibacillus louembei]|uniref:Transposase n=1 Tax=Lysinibacillus louembei TaxID=1470088 RepID=A0ABZ0RTX8_9BACI|nr:transposase [Lysinibacillus louembei]WPK10534.1 transposase [Lysinibacillus louembei]